MLQKHLTALLLVIGLTSVAFAQQEAPWQSFSSAEGKFNVLVPTKPEVGVRSVDSRQGKLTLYTYASSTKIAYFMVSYGDYVIEPTASQIETVLDEVRGGVLNGLKAELISEKSVPVNGLPGREFIAKGKEAQNAGVIFSWKTVLDGRRLYQLGVATLQKDSETPQIMKFFRSFELKRKPVE